MPTDFGKVRITRDVTTKYTVEVPADAGVYDGYSPEEVEIEEIDKEDDEIANELADEGPSFEHTTEVEFEYPPGSNTFISREDLEKILEEEDARHDDDYDSADREYIKDGVTSDD